MAHTHTHTIVIENGNGNRWDSCTAPRLTRLSLIQVKHQKAPASPKLPLSTRLLIKIYDFPHTHMSVCVGCVCMVWCCAVGCDEEVLQLLPNCKVGYAPQVIKLLRPFRLPHKVCNVHVTVVNCMRYLCAFVCVCVRGFALSQMSQRSMLLKQRE